MKRTIFLLTILVFALGLGFTEVRAQTPDYTASVGNATYSDSLKSTGYPVTNGTMRDSIDVSFTQIEKYNYFEITAVSTSADTILCNVLSPDGVTWTGTCFISMAQATLTTARVDKMITSSTATRWIVLGGLPSKFRFYSVGSSAIWFTVAGKRGVPLY
jgi:hypothetical protein